jgi:hypothetical protein
MSMKLPDYYIDRAELAGRVRRFIRANSITYVAVAGEMRKTGIVTTHKEVWNNLNNGIASYDRLDAVARACMAFGFQYRPLPDPAKVQAEIAAYLYHHGIPKIAVIRAGVRAGVFRRGIDAYRQFELRNHRITHRLIRAIRTMTTEAAV